MIKTLSLTAAFALSLSFVNPAGTSTNETPSAAESGSGAVAITLTTDNGELTDIAQQGFDVPATTASSIHQSGDTPLSRLTSPIARLAAFPQVKLEEDITEVLSEDYELFSAPIAIDDPFAIAALTWDSASQFPEDATIEMRTLDAGKWSQWYTLEQEECVTGAERCGSEYMISGSSTGIQARISHTENSLPTDLRIDISYSTSGEETIIDDPEMTDILPSVASLTQIESSDNIVLAASVKSASHNSQAKTVKKTQKNRELPTAHIDITQSSLSDGKANIKPRSAWGANENLRTWKPTYVNFEGVIIHHTAGSNSYTQTQVPSVIQGIYRYHAVTLDWGDIGYNVLIDKYGGRWEGRYGTLSSPKRQMVVGGHAKPRNTGTMGISVMGDYSNIQPTNTVLTALTEVSAWKFIDANVDPTSTSPLTIPSETSTMKNQVGKPLNRIVGHKDVYPTACPANIYNYLGQIRQNVQSLYQQSTLPEILANAQKKASVSGTAMFRLHNKISGEHLYTSDANEVLVLTRGNWAYEGVACVAPKNSTVPVYRLYSPLFGDHHYTADKHEIDVLTTQDKWVNEGVAWYSSTSTTKVPIYRQFSPKVRIGSHHFTSDLHEYQVNNSHGWQGEGVAWYANQQGW